jgi:hypothetical protein
MKRIYQERVTRVEAEACKDGDGEMHYRSNSQSAPWRHGLIQSSVSSEIVAQL